MGGNVLFSWSHYRNFVCASCPTVGHCHLLKKKFKCPSNARGVWVRAHGGALNSQSHKRRMNCIILINRESASKTSVRNC